MQELALRDAKAGFSAVVDEAVRGEETVVTRHGKPVAVVLGYAEWQALTRAKPGFAETLLAFPKGGEVARDPSPPRGLDE